MTEGYKKGRIKDMKEKKKAGMRRGLIAALAISLMLMVITVPAIDASAAELLTEKDPDTGVDGIMNDEHNSYAWCSAMFPQTYDDGDTYTDYLWVGTNRDAGGSILQLAKAAAALTGRDFDINAISELTGIPLPSDDKSAKIYRCNMETGEWELVWQEPAFSGYRKMVVFEGHLYVFAGLTNRLTSLSHQYATIYRFAPDYDPATDKPEVAMWGRFPSLIAETPELEFFRAATIHNDRLFVGTFDFKIYSTDGQGPFTTEVPRVMGAPAGTTYYDGWKLEINLSAALGAVPGANIWDIIGFNGSLYVFVAAEGFKVYKLTPNGSGYDIEQIVGNDDPAAPYPNGMGITGHVAASPFRSVQFGDEYIYVTTFANGPRLLTVAATGNLEQAFSNYFCPAAVYRFGHDDVWEMVVGDDGTASDKNGVPVDHVGNSRAGFFLGTGINTSANQYLWQMAEYDGRLYVTSWDIGVFKDAIPLMLISSLVQSFPTEEATAVAAAATEVYGNISDVIGNLNDAQLGYDIGNKMGEYALYMMQAIADPTKDMDDVRALYQEMVDEIELIVVSAAGPTDLQDLCDSMENLFTLAESFSTDAVSAIAATMQQASAVMPFLLDNSNPAGFDIFYTDDGVNFYPYTVNGLGDANNYGGRVLLKTEYGLISTTANPFTGCQVWLLNDYPVKAEMPSAFIGEPNDTDTFTVMYAGTLPADVSVTLGDGTVVSATVKYIGETNPSNLYFSDVSVVTCLLGRQSYQEEIYAVHLYSVTIKALAGHDGDLSVTFNADGTPYDLGDISVLITSEITVTYNSNGSDIGSETLTAGDKATKPADPEMIGYLFAGWFTDDVTFLSEWDFDDPVLADMVLFAKWTINPDDWVTVTYSNNGSVTEDTFITGNKATRPADPVKLGYVFAGWFDENDDAWDFATPVMNDMTLYAVWEEDPVTVTYNSNGGSFVDSETVLRGNPATEPADPTKLGYIFVGWVDENDDAWDFATPVMDDMTLYAVWEEDPVTVTYDSRGGSPVDSETVLRGNPATEP
ncbi:MAG: InlB B-repeat-containing protein, partial [Methanomassiliicoccaceae archaeon]|nr:InlB B-repeat-containing protein [Methanomassiliicoccaceae archaeon]